MIWSLLLLLLLILLSGFFSSAETAMMSIPEVRLRHLIDQKIKYASQLFRLRKNSHKLLITILIGNNLVNIGSATLATTLSIKLFALIGWSGAMVLGITTGIMTLLILTFGEIVPKSVASKHSQQLALAYTPVMSFLLKALYPIVIVFDKLTIALMKNKSTNTQPLLTEEEVQTIIKLSEEEGSIKEEEKEMIQNIFKLDNISIGAIMTARPDVFAFEQTKLVSDVIKSIISEGYSRIPLYSEDLDNVTGILYTKDLIGVDLNTPLSKLKREAYFVPKTKNVDEMLNEFKKKKLHMAIVLNEHSTMIGVVTIEDLLEEIVGEIYDETDDQQEMNDVIKNGKHSYLLRGRAEIEFVSKKLNVEFDEDEYETISGFLMSELDRIPKEGDEVKFDNFIFKVEKIANNRIELVSAVKTQH